MNQAQADFDQINDVIRGARMYANAHAFVMGFPEMALARDEKLLMQWRDKGARDIRATSNVLLQSAIVAAVDKAAKELMAQSDSRFELYKRALAHDELQTLIPSPENLQALLGLVAKLKASIA